MGRTEEKLRLDGSPEREFAFWLRDLRNHAGLTYQRLARAANYSTSTMQAAAAGRQLPTLKVTMAFVTACKGDRALWEKYWTQVKRALDNDSPYGIDRPVIPPWAPSHVDSTALKATRYLEPTRMRTVQRRFRHARTGAVPGSAASSLCTRPARRRHGISVDCKDGWYVESFAASLRLDTPQPEAIEDRVIVSTVDGLREIATSISVPRHPDDSGPEHRLDTELLYGGSLALSDQPHESYFRNVIALAQPLEPGEHHEYRLRLRVPSGQPMAPHYVYMPFQRTDHFALRVRFDPERIPTKIWALSGTPPVVIYKDGPDGAILKPDRFGEICVEFRDLRLGLGYGVHWQE